MVKVKEIGVLFARRNSCYVLLVQCHMYPKYSDTIYLLDLIKDIADKSHKDTICIAHDRAK